MITLKIQALKFLPETTQLDEALIASFTFDEVMTMIELGISNLSIFHRWKTIINWRYVAETMSMSETMIGHFAYYLDWRAVSKHQKLSEELIRDYRDKVYWPNIVQFQQLSFDFVQEYLNHQNTREYFRTPHPQWSDEQFDHYMRLCTVQICRDQKLSENYIRANLAKIDWSALSLANRTWSDEFLHDFIARLESDYLFSSATLTEAQILFLPKSQADWKTLSFSQVLSREFIIHHHQEVDWCAIACKQVLSQDLIEYIQNIDTWTDEQREQFSWHVTEQARVVNFPQLCDWTIISARGDINEAILAEFPEEVAWELVSIEAPSDSFMTMFHTRLLSEYVSNCASEKFLLAHPIYINENVQGNQRIISMDFFHKYFDLFGGDYLSEHCYLSSAFIERNFDRLNQRYLTTNQELSLLPA